MAKKTRRQQPPRRRPTANAPARATPPPAAGVGNGGPLGDDADVATVDGDGIADPGAAPTSGSVEVGRKRIGRIDPTSAQGRRGRPSRPGNLAAQFEPLDPEDAAIPFDRVPYVPSDLRRVAMIALLMLAIILVAAVVVTHLVT